MSQLGRFGLILGITCLVSTLILAATYQVTKPTIAATAEREEKAALNVVIPEADSFKEKTVDGIDYFEAYRGKDLAGYCIKVTGQGYSGYIHMIVGIDTSGIIKGVEVMDQQETPGLGARIAEVKPGESSPWFLRQFAGKEAASLALKKNIDSITGATISSKAVTDAIKKTVGEFLQKAKK